VQNGMNLILPSSPLSPDLGPAGHLAPEVSRVSVRHPHLGQKAGAVELGEHSGVNVIRLDLGLGERPGAEGIGDDDPPHLGLPHADDRVGVARRFQHDVVRAGHRAHAMTGRVGTDTVILDTNPIESTFATGRPQERVVKDAGPRTAGPTTAFKGLEAAVAHWRRLDAPELVPPVRAGSDSWTASVWSETPRSGRSASPDHARSTTLDHIPLTVNA